MFIFTCEVTTMALWLSTPRVMVTSHEKTCSHEFSQQLDAGFALAVVIAIHTSPTKQSSCF
jgi:hypothetical protein